MPRNHLESQCLVVSAHTDGNNVEYWSSPQVRMMNWKKFTKSLKIPTVIQCIFIKFDSHMYEFVREHLLESTCKISLHINIAQLPAHVDSHVHHVHHALQRPGNQVISVPLCIHEWSCPNPNLHVRASPFPPTQSICHGS